MVWFYADDREQQHEVSEETLADLVGAGTVRRDTLVWNETMPDWKECQSVLPRLFEGVPAPPLLTSAQRQQAAGAAIQPGYAGAVPPQTDAVAVCALIFGVLGLLCFQLFSPVGIICGHIALKRANESGDLSANKGLAIAGLVTGYLGLLVFVFIIAIYGFALFASIAGAAAGS